MQATPTEDGAPAVPNEPPYPASKTRKIVIPIFALALFALIVINANWTIVTSTASLHYPRLKNLPNPVTYKRASSNSSDALPEATLHTLRENSFIVQGESVKRRVVIITAATYHYLDFIRNLRCSVRAATGQEVVLFALDQNVSVAANKLGIKTIDAFYKHQDVRSDTPFAFGSNGFNVISKLKLHAFRDALLAGIDVLFTDVDVVFCDDAPSRLVAQLEARNSAHVLIQNGRPSDTFWPADANTGFFYATADGNVVDMFSYLARLANDPSSRGDFDQSLFKNKICGTDGPGVALRNTDTGHDVHVCRWENHVNVEMLPLKLYPNGHSPLGREFRKLGTGELRKACVRKDIVVFHNNWCSGSAKIQRMDKEDLWSIDKNTKQCRDLPERR